MVINKKNVDQRAILQKGITLLIANCPYINVFSATLKSKLRSAHSVNPQEEYIFTFKSVSAAHLNVQNTVSR
ncbi:hypothetical protein F3J29_03900 [Enterobacter sp. Cy-643]|nr:hypothetical protein [Enterobacter sp. Cy-643]